MLEWFTAVEVSWSLVGSGFVLFVGGVSTGAIGIGGVLAVPALLLAQIDAHDAVFIAEASFVVTCSITSLVNRNLLLARPSVILCLAAAPSGLAGIVTVLSHVTPRSQHCICKQH